MLKNLKKLKEMLKFAYFLIVIVILINIISCSSHSKQTYPPLQVVPYVDIKRYTGVWYEIARYPHKFQEDCAESKATYTLSDDGNIIVLNECNKKTNSSKIKSVKGKAWIVDKETNAKLKVSFFWPFTGDYWIIDLGKNYDYAVIGHPDRKYLWILSRTKKMNEELYQEILSRLKDKQYDTSKLIKTEQQ